MKKYEQTKRIATALAGLVLCGLSVQAYADSQGSGVTYSPEHWPNRWSSAIRQQQDNRFPTRQKPQAPQANERESVSEQDLFYVPSSRNRYDFDRHQDRFDERMSRQRYFREAQRMSRDAAYAYHDVYPAYPYAGFPGGWNGFPYGTAPLGIDPVLGHPGIGIPIMPGTPFGYPYAGFPGVWGGYPPFGVW